MFPAPLAVFLNEDNTNYVEPDISVICDSSKLDDKGCHGAPDWIIEIVSPATSRWIILQSCLNIERQVLESIGLLILQKR